MSVSRTVSVILISIKEWRDLEILDWVVQWFKVIENGAIR